MSWSQGFPNSFSPTQQTQEVLKNTDNETKRLYQILSEAFAADGHAHTGDGSDGAQINYEELLNTPGKLAINAKDYGVVGDGITDDTIKMQDALTAVSSGGILFIPSGDYLISNSFNIPSNVTVVGCYGKTRLFRIDNGFYILKLSNVENVTIKGLSLDGGIASAAIDGSDEQKHVLVVSETKNSLISGCIIKNAGGDGIYLGDNPTTHAASDNVKIEKCVIDTVGRNGISITGASYCEVSRNKISGARGPIVGVGIDIEPNISDTCISNMLIGNILTNNNIGITIAGTDTDRINYGHLVQNNIAYKNGRGIQCSGKYVSYIGNICSENDWIGLYVNNAKNSMFQLNSINDNGKVTSTFGQVNITDSQEILFSNNTIYMTDPSDTATSSQNLYLGGTNTNVLIIANVLYPFKTGGSAFGDFGGTSRIFMLNSTDGTQAHCKTPIYFDVTDVAQTFQFNMNFYKGNGVGNFSFKKGVPGSSTDVWTCNNSGLTNQTGSMQINGVQVVTAQQSAVANATNATDVITQLNSLLAKLRTHGLIAT